MNGYNALLINMYYIFHYIIFQAFEVNNYGEVEYDLIGKKTCMGDHKVLYYSIGHF